MDKAEVKARRDELLSAAIRGIKLSKEEREYMLTTPAYIQLEPTPSYYFDIIDLQPDVMYKITVRRTTLFHTENFYPSIDIPTGEGFIQVDADLRDCRGKLKKDHRTKALGLLPNPHRKEWEFLLKSQIGKMRIRYHCCAMMPLMGRYYMADSLSGDSRLAMSKKILAQNKVKYFCKDAGSQRPKAYHFSVEWKALDELE